MASFMPSMWLTRARSVDSTNCTASLGTPASATSADAAPAADVPTEDVATEAASSDQGGVNLGLVGLGAGLIAAGGLAGWMLWRRRRSDDNDESGPFDGEADYALNWQPRPERTAKTAREVEPTVVETPEDAFETREFA